MLGECLLGVGNAQVDCGKHGLSLWLASLAGGSAKAQENSAPQSADTGEEVTLILSGDVMLARGITNAILKHAQGGSEARSGR